MERTHCGGCGEPRDWIETFLDLGETPLANDLPRTQDQNQVLYPLQVGVCNVCWLAQMMHTPAADEVFGGDYTFYSSTSPALVAYHTNYALELLNRYRDSNGIVVEVACNDGDLLRHFHNAGRRAFGIDPAAGPVAVARDRGLTVEHTALTHESAYEFRKMYGPASLVIANHVTAHVIDLLDFLAGIHSLLAQDGHAILEVQYLPDLLTGNHFDHVYHEHRYFFSLSSLLAAATAVNLVAADVRLNDQQGGSMQVTFVRDSFAIRDSDGLGRVSALLVREQLVRHMSAYGGAQMRAERVRDRLLEVLESQRAAGLVVAGYGMPAKATTLLNFCGIDRRLVSHIVDTTPAKIGRYAPGVKIPVVGPNDRNEPDTYLVLVWNYLRGILQRESRFQASGGEFIVPLPVPVVL